MTKWMLFFISTAAMVLSGCLASEAEPIDPMSPISGLHHYVDGYAPILDDDTVQVVIEIPTGTTQKWEVNKSDGKIHWEIKDGKPRVVKYLGYPGNYGMVPKTLLSYENGGDGDPVDVLVLGPPVERGSVVNTKLIGVLNLFDGGEQDDKLIGVMEGTPFYDIKSVQELRETYPGMLQIVETWFENYKGTGKLKASGFSGPKKAKSTLNSAIETYAAEQNK